ncbi:MAG TPA: hypothetical protein VD838_01095 [Anaeromyxobacteraceae bacterium]|nr:hypothetical protein [Anaeromyxobacteraceae bacterium]
MTRTKITLLCLPLAIVGLAAAVHATLRVERHERELAALAEAGRAEGASFVETLRGAHAERQRLAYDKRRELALALAAARRDRLLGVMGVAGAGVLLSALLVLRRIGREIEEDRRHLGAQDASHRPEPL